MTWTYTQTFASAYRDQIRLLIGDTDSTDQQLQDEEIAYLYGLAGSSITAGAILACETLSAKYARFADSSVGDLSISYSQRVENYKGIIATLRGVSARSFTPLAGGISISRVDTVEEDDDRVVPAFAVGMMSNPDVAQTNDEETA